MVIGKFLLEVLAVIIFLSIVSTMVMYYFGISPRKLRKKSKDES